MNRNLLCTVSCLVVILLALAAPALAGGWATITVDEWPAQIVANEPVLIGFTVRQHGHDEARLTGLTPAITGKNDATGKTISVDAKAEGAAGHYMASVTFPEAGSWSWTIHAFSMDQPMPKLNVGEPVINAPAIKPPPVTGNSDTPAILAGFLGLAFVGLAIGLAYLKRPRWALALVIVALLAWGVGIASAANKPDSLAPPASEPAADIPAAGKTGASMAITQGEYGKILFIAKGCATCHTHPQVELALNPIRVDVGKNLTGYVASPEFLRIWLKDPKAVKPNTEMPNLELSEAEIEALIAFINPSTEVK